MCLRLLTVTKYKELTTFAYTHLGVNCLVEIGLMETEGVSPSCNLIRLVLCIWVLVLQFDTNEFSVLSAILRIYVTISRC